MPKMIQIRNVLDELYGTLKAKVMRLEMTLSNYLLDLGEQVVEKPTLSEMMERLRGQKPVELERVAGGHASPNAGR